MIENIAIEKGNKLIAEYMGAIPEQWYPENKPYGLSGIHYAYPSSGSYPDNSRYHADHLLKYHTSLDWIILVIEKLKKIMKLL